MLSELEITNLKNYQAELTKMFKINKEFNSNESVIAFTNLQRTTLNLQKDLQDIDSKVKKNFNKVDEDAAKKTTISKELDDILSIDFTSLDVSELEYYIKQLEKLKAELDNLDKTVSDSSSQLNSLSTQATGIYRQKEDVDKRIKEISPKVLKFRQEILPKFEEAKKNVEILKTKVNPDLVAKIDVFKKKNPKSPNAVVKMSGKACGGCGMQKDATFYNTVKAEGYAICDCGRIVLEEK